MGSLTVVGVNIAIKHAVNTEFNFVGFIAANQSSYAGIARKVSYIARHTAIMYCSVVLPANAA